LRLPPKLLTLGLVFRYLLGSPLPLQGTGPDGLKIEQSSLKIEHSSLLSLSEFENLLLSAALLLQNQDQDQDQDQDRVLENRANVEAIIAQEASFFTGPASKSRSL